MILILAGVFLVGLVGARQLIHKRRKQKVLIVSVRRELESKRPAQVWPQTVVLPAVDEDVALRTDTVLMAAIKPEDYPWARA